MHACMYAGLKEPGHRARAQHTTSTQPAGTLQQNSANPGGFWSRPQRRAPIRLAVDAHACKQADPVDHGPANGF